MFEMSLIAKKADHIFEDPATFFLLLLYVLAKNTIKVKKLFNLNYRLRKNTTPTIDRLLLILLSTIPVYLE